MTLSEAKAQFEQWGRGKYANSTINTYVGLVTRFVDYCGDKPVSEVTMNDIIGYYSHLQKRGCHNATIAFTMIAIRQFWKFQFLQRKTELDYQLIPVPKYLCNSYLPAEPQDSQRLINAYSEKNFMELRNKTIISFLATSGVRVGELVKIRLDNLKLAECYGSIISEKNQKRRMIFWGKDTRRLLDIYLPQRETLAQSRSLFISLDRKNKGRELETRSIQRIVQNARVITKMDKPISPHSFRHGLGMLAVQKHLHPRVIQKILGHKNINSSQVYMDMLDTDLVKEYATLDT